MATYWVETGHGGTDSGTETNPWLTIQQALTAVAQDDHVWVKGGIDYTEAALFVTNGGWDAPITIEGYTTSTGDGGQFTMDGGGSLSSAMLDPSSGAKSSHYIWRNMVITNYASHGFNILGGDYNGFRNCEFTNNGNNGIWADNDCYFVNCKITNNAWSGCEGGYRDVFINCEVGGNGYSGVTTNDSNMLIYNSLIYGNGQELGGDNNCSLADGGWVLNCTIDGENITGSNGVNFASSANHKSIINCIIYDCDVGILNAYPARYQPLNVGLNNLLNSNNNDYDGWPTSEQASDITAAPGFENEAGGDYTLAADSAARNAGADVSGTASPGMDIGAHQSADEASAGGKTVIIG
jgi:hypothetical protein